MATSSGKIEFPNMMGTKRRRMRSGGNVSTATNNAPKGGGGGDDEKTAETSRCKGATTIPIFLKKTYKMIDTCDPKVASWTPDGEMFVVKDPDVFARTVIPQYFDHNKFSSFARQLNFYGFRKMQSKPIRNADYNIDTAKHVTFYNEKFKRGRCDLLKEIQRSTRGGGNASQQDAVKELMEVKKQVADLEHKMEELNTATEERMRRLELDMLSRMEQMMLAMQQHQQTQLQLQSQVSSGTTSAPADAVMRQTSVAWDPLPLDVRQKSTNSVSFGPSVVTRDTSNTSTANGPTLPPHPKQKQFPAALGVANGMNALKLPPSRLNSLRGISRGVSRGVSEQSSASAVLMRNSWEDKFFSMLMLGENEAAAAAAAAAAVADPLPIADPPNTNNNNNNNGNVNMDGSDKLHRQTSDNTFSSVSETEAL